MTIGPAPQPTWPQHASPEVELGHGARSLPARPSRLDIQPMEESSNHRGAGTYMAALGAELRLSGCQAEAWAEYIAVLQSNRERMEIGASADAPFGPVTERITALAAMRRAASQLDTRLSPSQRERAGELLPLCCETGARAAAG
jgi:hypothetical protein